MANLRLRYQTLEFGDEDIHLRTLRDNQQFDDPQGEAECLGISSAAWPIFGVVWPSGSVLAERMWTHEIAGKRILEVGCGIAVASLVLNQRHADVTATDRHPEAHKFLRENVRINEGRPIPFVRLGWADPASDLGTFDLIIGSDLLYERAHVTMLSAFIARHATAECEVMIVDPGRGEQGRFNKAMAAYGFTQIHPASDEPGPREQAFSGRILHHQRAAAPSE